MCSAAGVHSTSPCSLWNVTFSSPDVGRDSVELDDEVHVPGGSPELAVRHGTETDILLQAHRVADGLVLDRAQFGRVDPSLREVVARGEQVRRAEQAADVVGAERRCRALTHQAGAWQTASTLFPSRSWTKAP